MASVPFNNLITFSRGSNATVTGPTGLVQWAPNNFTTFSEQFDNAQWVKTATTVTANTTVAPDGTTTADTVTPTATGFSVKQDYNFAGTYTASASVKDNGAGSCLFAMGTGAIGYLINVNLSTGAFVSGRSYGGGVLLGYTITSQGNGWWRISVSATANLGGVVIASADGTTPTQGVHVWGAQLELGSAATTYNSTTVKNLLGFSEAFDNAAWTKTRTSIVTGAQANPVNGAFNAQKLMEDTTASNTHLTSQAFTALAIPYVVSVYAKKAERQRITLRENSASGDAATFDLNSGTVVANFVGGVGSIQSVGNGWYRCSVLFTATAGGRSVAVLLNTNTGSGFESYTGDGNSGVYIYGAQLSDSASLDPYVPTPAAAPSSTAYYGPRFDYDPVTLAPKGLLVEEARTNSLTYSEQLDNGAWTKANVTVTANAAVAPDGTTTADKIIATNSASTTRAVYQNFTSLAATTYTVSVYVKAAEYSLFAIQEIGGGRFGASFDLVNQTTASLGGTGFVSSSITSAGNGWFRCAVVWTGLAAGNAITFIGYPAGASLSAAGTSYAGDGTSGIYLYGAQLEAGAFATSYIPTVASTVTRSADVATINGSLFSQWYGQPQGTFVFVGDAVNIATNSPAYDASDGTNNNRVSVGPDFSSVQAVVRSGGATVATLPRSIGLLAGTVFKHSLAYTVDNFAVALNGGDVSTDTSGAVPIGVNQIGLGGNNPLGANKINGHIRSIDYIPARAADFQLQALTALSVVDYNFLQTAAGDQLVDGNGDALYSIPIFG